VIVAAVIATAIGVPLGIWAARRRGASVVLRPVLDFMQTTPVFVYLIPAVFFFGIGVVPGVVATTIFSIPPAVRLTELGIRGVDAEVVEAAHAFGAHPRQILREVQLPMALPSIMAGVNQVIMLALSMVVVAGLAGAGGLGSTVVSAVTQLDVATGFEGGLAVVIVAIFLDRFTSALAQRPSHGLWARLRSRRAPSRSLEPGSTVAVVDVSEPRHNAAELFLRLGFGEQVTSTVHGRPRVRLVPVAHRTWRTYVVVSAGRVCRSILWPPSVRATGESGRWASCGSESAASVGP
jgi:glycine betaine/proline transport system permease protein